MNILVKDNVNNAKRVMQEVIIILLLADDGKCDYIGPVTMRVKREQ